MREALELKENPPRASPTNAHYGARIPVLTEPEEMSMKACHVSAVAYFHSTLIAQSASRSHVHVGGQG